MRDIRELFPTDDPVRPDLLIGRAGDVNDLARRLGSGTHMVLAGPRRTGKSTVALAALAQAHSSRLYTAQVDLWDHEDMASLTRSLAQSILANRGPVAKALGRAREEWTRAARAPARRGGSHAAHPSWRGRRAGLERPVVELAR